MISVGSAALYYYISSAFAANVKGGSGCLRGPMQVNMRFATDFMISYEARFYHSCLNRTVEIRLRTNP